MPRYVDLVVNGNTQTVTSETALTQSPYTPSVTGNVIAETQTTTAAANGGYLRLSCTTFGGVDHIAPITLVTVAAGGAASPRAEYALADSVFCSLPIRAGTPITIKLKYTAAPTAPVLDIFFGIVGA